MLRGIVATLCLALACSACGKPLTITSDDADAADAADGDATMTLPDGAVVPRDAGNGAATDAAVDAPGPPPKCNKTVPCGGTPILTSDFTIIGPPYVPGGTGTFSTPTIETSDFISPPSSLRTTSPAGQTGSGPTGSYVTVSIPAVASVCAQICVKLDETSPPAFGPSNVDTVTFFRLDLDSTMPVALGVEAAAHDGVFMTNGAGQFTQVLGGFPRGRWFFMKLQIDYRGSNVAVALAIDGGAGQTWTFAAQPTTTSVQLMTQSEWSGRERDPE